MGEDTRRPCEDGAEVRVTSLQAWERQKTTQCHESWSQAWRASLSESRIGSDQPAPRFWMSPQEL